VTDDRDLVHRVGSREQARHESVSRLVVGRDRLLVGAEHATAALRTQGDPLGGGLQIVTGDATGVAASRQQRAFVEEVCQVCPGKARSLPGDNGKVDVRGKWFSVRVDLQDREATGEIGKVDDDLAVKAARPQEGRIENVGSVGSG